jgi:hypothetical protein
MIPVLAGRPVHGTAQAGPAWPGQCRLDSLGHHLVCDPSYTLPPCPIARPDPDRFGRTPRVALRQCAAGPPRAARLAPLHPAPRGWPLHPVPKVSDSWTPPPAARMRSGPRPFSGTRAHSGRGEPHVRVPNGLRSGQRLPVGLLVPVGGEAIAATLLVADEAICR